MRKSGALAAGVFTVVSMTAFVPASARADADKEHKVIMAEIRMLQEEQQQVRAVLANLSETLKALNTRLDTDAGRTQKAFADQKLVIDGVAETTRILREKADETNVRISSMGQELQTLRQTVVVDACAGAGHDARPTDRSGRHRARGAPAPAPGNPPANISPTQMWDRVYASLYRRPVRPCRRGLPVRTSARSRRRRRPTMRSSTPDTRSTTPASIRKRSRRCSA